MELISATKTSKAINGHGGNEYAIKYKLGKVEDYTFADIEICLKEECKQRVKTDLRLSDNITYDFTVCGNVWKRKHSNIIMAGQILDYLYEKFSNDDEFVKIYKWWKDWHLNTLNAGTDKQMEYIKKHEKEIRKSMDCGDKCYYTACCEKLKEGGLYEDKGYKYGTEWLYRELPQEIIDYVKKVVEENDKD